MQCRAMGHKIPKEEISRGAIQVQEGSTPSLLSAHCSVSQLSPSSQASLPRVMDSMRVSEAFVRNRPGASLHMQLSPGLSERMVCRIMSDMVSLRWSVVFGRHQPSLSVHTLSVPSLR